MPRERSPYYPPSRWDRVRKPVLARDDHTCQVRLKCDGAHATEVDHIVPWRDGGAWYEWDPDWDGNPDAEGNNLRASCKPCNIARASLQKHHQGWKRADTEIVLVVRAALPQVAPAPGDQIIDVERLTKAVAVAEPTVADRTAASRLFTRLVADLTRGESDADRVWLVVDSTEGADMFPHHSIIAPHTADDPAHDVRHSIEPGRW